jgi:subtilisin family serine protease
MHHRPRRLVALAATSLLVMAVAASLLAGGAASAAGSSNYLVVYKSQNVPNDAATSIQNAGGTIVTSYSQIGVVIARSDSDTFRSTLLKDGKVENASPTAGFATQLPSQDTTQGGDLPNAPATDSDTLSGLQWDMRQIKAPEAHAITGGSPSVLVGDIDTGIDFTHPDLAANISVADSANCVSGVAVQGTAAQDDNGHGTHTAGTIAAASNGIGIVGVAPNVKIAGIKAGNADGFFFPEAVVCSFMWAASHHMDVTNNSYFADPWLFNCKNDPVQRGIWAAESRAIQYAEQQGVTVVAAEGNQADDLAHPTVDSTSPDDTTPVDRSIHNNCAVVPVEVPGVVGVTADGHNLQDPSGYLKSFYSSFGVGSADVVAPGGDSRYGVNAEATNGRVLSTWPASLAGDCLRKVFDGAALYCYQQGTSMASPHAAGVAALIVSKYGHMASSKVSAILQQTADAQPCPSSLPTGYLTFTALDGGAVQSCQGGAGSNSWYGRGQVNALSAIGG